MSQVLGSREGVKARKRHQCCLCGEAILPGDFYDSRQGVNSDGWWTMHMHPECHTHEQIRGTVDPDWYEDTGGEPAFERPKKAKS